MAPAANNVNNDVPEDKSRRNFLAEMAIIGGAAMSISILPAMSVANEETGEEHKVTYAFLVDTTKCIGCARCVEACVAENSVPEGYLRTWVERYVYFEDGTITVDSHPKTAPFSFGMFAGEHEALVSNSFYVSKLCNHCVNTPCIQVCPVNASYMTPEGVVLIDKEHCIGCSYCVQACPFNTRFINPVTQTADKCTWCYHRLKKGLRTACVTACPTGTRIIGNIEDPEDPVHIAFTQKRVDVLKSYMGTRPKTRYIGLTTDVI